ncbi:hypothetical protein PIB30_044404 [Stylosanthes scabra]|uniref:Stigma-specific STIG1-like protein 1 n=1 Tax=Stylosanthes scabra TaxID=79078 RepID=A0ABU6YGB3_9FABA|nr:hypothetical protein [Stylosanthes scabra]
MNKFVKSLFVVSMVMMALAITMPASTEASEEQSSLRGRSRFLFSEKSSKGSVETAACDKCNNKCVDFSTDQLNCGRCGKKCGHNKICCVGKCVNPMTNEKHCGKCGNKCNSKGSCVYGLCNYA